MAKFAAVTAGLLLFSGLAAGSAAAAHPAGAGGADAAARCAGLVGAYDALPDAPTRVESAEMVAATPALPAYCRVRGAVTPKVGFELRLPVSTWNRKVFEYGRGGYCRTISMQDCDNPLRKGYACVISDQGHKDTSPDDTWEHDNLQALVDCGFRGDHVTAVASKAIVQRYYDRAPEHAYFMGCSTGGRMAMMEAERFPWDFDGVIAGAPPMDKSGDGLALTWSTLATLGRDGRPILPAQAIELLAKAALAACDMDDGLADGVISDPLACRFDPAALQCRKAAAKDCLTADEVAAARRIYRGPRTGAGVALYDGAPLPGSEPNWIGTFVTRDGSPSPVGEAMQAMFAGMNTPGRPPGWTIAAFDWDRDYKLRSLFEAFNAADNPDLRRFKAAGGKLILYHGLQDAAVMPGSTVDYYQTLERTMGGAERTRDFARLFLVPGMGHCWGGPGASVIDYVAALEDWVERGRAPDRLLAAHPKDPAMAAAPLVRLPLASADVGFTRPIYAYPQIARYKGGDPTLASSFTPAPSRAPPDLGLTLQP